MLLLQIACKMFLSVAVFFPCRLCGTSDTVMQLKSALPTTR